MSTEQTTTPNPADGVESGDPDPAALIGRTDDWWVGYSAGCEASHAAGCCEVMGEQRITDLQAEFARTDKIRDRQLEATRATARAALAAAASSAPPVGVPARPDLKESAARICAALNVDPQEDGWADEVIRKIALVRQAGYGITEEGEAAS